MPAPRDAEIRSDHNLLGLFDTGRSDQQMSNWWVTTELDEFGGFQRDWYGPYPTEGDAEKAALQLARRGQELVAETVFGVAGREGTRFAEFVKGQKFATGASGWFVVKPSVKIKIPASGKG